MLYENKRKKLPLDPGGFIFYNGIMKKYLQAKLEENRIGFTSIRKIRGEASTRAFYRVFADKYSLVAMVYPQDTEAEIEKIIKLTAAYKAHGINVPEIKDRFENRILLLEDLGDQLAQKKFAEIRKQKEEKERFLEEAADILIRLKGIPLRHTTAVLDTARMKWEMDFFLDHFARSYLPAAKDNKEAEGLRSRLYRLADAVIPVDTFAHRDFHSRNMLVHNRRIYLVDFQDSLKASPYYDLVSFAFDSYLDLDASREFLLQRLETKGMNIDEELLYLTALQRNIKALGTFGFQVKVRKNLAYKKYIARTLRHVLANKMFKRFFRQEFFTLSP
jgi:aminoglycoside/choline kinase family phosphotransferase